MTNYIKMLVEDIHSTIVATIGSDGHPQTRVIDMMLYDNEGIYFLTAKGKAFYTQLMEQQYIALSSVKDKIAISLRGKIKNIGSEKLNEIFEKNTYMQSIYPNNTRTALQVFQIYEAQGEYFDISDPKHIVRENITIGNSRTEQIGYFIEDTCTGCKVCKSVCPQNCIDFTVTPAVIRQENCLHCGNCLTVCPKKAVVRKG